MSERLPPAPHSVDQEEIRELTDIPSVEVISRAAVVPDEPGAGPGENFTGPVV